MKKHLLLILLIPVLAISQVQVGSDLLGNDNNESLGHDLQVSLDGTTLAVVGTKVSVYRNSGNSWVKAGDDLDGFSVSISEDGNIIAVGDFTNDDSAEDAGSVTIYEFLSDNWVQKGNIIYGDTAGDESGKSISLSNNGQIIAIGSPGFDDLSAQNVGQVRIFEYGSGTNQWEQLGYYIGSLFADSDFSEGLSLSGDGNRIIIGAPKYSLDSYVYGLVQIYENVSGVWTSMDFQFYEGGLLGSINDELGTGVAISNDGNTVVIGIRRHDSTASANDDIGRVDIYEFDTSESEWIKTGEIEGEEEDGLFGDEVSISADGSIIAVSTPYGDSNSIEDTGHVKIYKNNSGTWNQIGNTIYGDLEGESFGFKASLSGNANLIAISAPVPPEFKGKVETFNLEAVLSTKTLAKASFTMSPVPVKDILHVNLTSDITLQQISIYNTLGQIVKVSKHKNVNVSKLSKGFYIVKVNTNQGEISKQIVVE